MNEEYVREFRRWTAGPAERRAAITAELEEHLTGAEAAGELNPTLERLGPPREAAKAFAAGHELSPAPLGRRFVAFLIDVAIPVLAAIVVTVLGTVTGIGRGTEELADFVRALDARRSVSWGPLQMLAAVAFGLAWLWWLVGLAAAEWRYGRTPGKALMRLRVVTEDGIAISFGQAVVRNLTRAFSGPLQILDWAWALFDTRRQRALDKLAHTLVVRDGALVRHAAAPAHERVVEAAF